MSKSLITEISLLCRNKNDPSNTTYFLKVQISTIDFCSTVFGLIHVTQILRRFVNFEKRAASYIWDAVNGTPSRRRFENVCWLTFHEQLIVNKYVLLNKSLFNITPVCWDWCFNSNKITNTISDPTAIRDCLYHFKLVAIWNSFQKSTAI